MSKKARRRPTWKKRSERISLIERLARALKDLRAGNYIETSWPEGPKGPRIVCRYVGGVRVS